MKSDMIVEQIKEQIKDKLNPKRLRHTLGVLDYSLMLAKRHDVDSRSVTIAALYHDSYRNHTREELLRLAQENNIYISPEEEFNPVLLHGPLAASTLRHRYPDLENIDEIVDAVKYHTSGYYFKSKIGKILFIADSLENNRVYPGADELRKLSLEDLDGTFKKIIQAKLGFSLKKGQLILQETVIAYNKLIIYGAENDD